MKKQFEPRSAPKSTKEYEYCRGDRPVAPTFVAFVSFVVKRLN